MGDKKLDKWSLLGIGGLVLGVAGTVVGSIVDKKQMSQKIQEEVAKAVQSKQ